MTDAATQCGENAGQTVDSIWFENTHPGACPFVEDTRVEAVRRNGDKIETLAGMLDWRVRGVARDIVRSRVAPATDAPALSDRLPMTAPDFCQKAADLMAERGKTYDKGGKAERSMAATVTAFNAITGRDLSEPEGWLLMSLVKRVRQYQNPSFHRDSAEDAVAYAALEAEALAAGDEA